MSPRDLVVPAGALVALGVVAFALPRPDSNAGVARPVAHHDDASGLAVEYCEEAVDARLSSPDGATWDAGTAAPGRVRPGRDSTWTALVRGSTTNAFNARVKLIAACTVRRHGSAWTVEKVTID